MTFLCRLSRAALSTMFNDVNEKVGDDCCGGRQNSAAMERKRVFDNSDAFGKCNTPDCGAYHHLYSLL